MSIIDEGHKLDGIDKSSDDISTNEWDELIGKLQEARAKINEIIK